MNATQQTSTESQPRRGQVRSFRAASIEAANVLIRRELGADAIIVSSKRIVKKGRFPWSNTSGDVVVTARSAVVQPETVTRKQQLGRDPRNVRINRAPLSATLLERAEPETDAPLNPDNPPPTDPPLTDDQQDGSAELTEVLSKYEQQLTAADVDSTITAELLTSLRAQTDQVLLNDSVAMDSLLTAIVESEISTANPIQVVPGHRRVVALVGPAGVGKTTTLSKLAAHFAINDTVKMAIITFDTYRIAAVEQLRTYAGIIDIPVHVVTNPLEMRRATEETQDVDLVLIDTGGHSPNDELRMQELRQLLIEAGASDTLLCLSTTSGHSSLELYGERFAAIGANALVVTKTDEAAGPGGVMTVLRATGLPVSYVSTGQNVPADLEPASATCIARRITGQETS